MPEAVSGLAASIRSAVESETFDLAGQNSATIEKTIHDAFAEPFQLQTMIRITFITGAGKLGRQKYDEGAARALTQTLRGFGFEEDRGASAIMECAGSWKMQHDTGKNLKTVVVFPKVTTGGGGGGGASGDMAGLSLDDEKGESLLPEGSPEHKIAHTSMNTFQRMITSMCPSWSQKKGCVVAVESIKKQLEELDEKLVQGTLLSASEQDFYDSVSATSLDEKLSCVRDLMHKQVDDGQITMEERRALLDQVSDRISKLKTDIADAKKDGKKKKVENLSAALTKAEERKEKLEKISPISPHPLKNEAEINKLHTELLPLLDVEEAAKGRLLSLKESQAVGRKEEILEDISLLEEYSRGWFESDESFEVRVKASQSKREVKKRQSKKAAKSSKGAGGGGGNVWKSASSSAASTKFVTPARKTAAAKPKGNKLPRGGGVFAAMMMDDSDSD